MSDPLWQDLIRREDLEENWVTRTQLGRRSIAVYDTPSGVFASLALCTHGGADLCDGYFDGHVIECPLHQGAFDVRTGEPVAAPASRTLRVIEARVFEGMVQVRI